MRENLPKREQVPDYHYTCQQSKTIIEILADASLEAKAALADVIDQFFVDTATWGLEYWEQCLGIYAAESENADYRRSRIKSRLRGTGTTTVAMIRNVAKSFSNGEVDVTEIPEQYRVEIKFVDTLGVPPNINDLTASLHEIMPAHLQWDYIIIYNTWSSVASKTWADMAGYTWGEAKESEIT